MLHRMLVNAFLADARRPWRRDVPTGAVPDRVTVSGRELETRGELFSALSTLGPSQRAVVVLRYWEDLSVEQTAQVLGCSPGNVKSQSARALQNLRRGLTLADEPDTEGERP